MLVFQVNCKLDLWRMHHRRASYLLQSLLVARSGPYTTQDNTTQQRTDTWLTYLPSFQYQLLGAHAHFYTWTSTPSDTNLGSRQRNASKLSKVAS